MTILGAILAGGTARRFGSDKARAMLDGRMLLDHVADALAPQVDALVVVGRDWPGLMRIDDHPGPGLGPLAGLAGALHQAERVGHARVLSVPCDTPDLPDTLAALLAAPGGPAFVRGLPVAGLWPRALAGPLDRHLADTADRSMRGWIARCGAVAVDLPRAITNVNRPGDLPAP